MKRITEDIDAHAAARPDCPSCLGTGLVCEDHPRLAWGAAVSDDSDPWPGACYCGAPGMPCLLINGEAGP